MIGEAHFMISVMPFDASLEFNKRVVIKIMAGEEDAQGEVAYENIATMTLTPNEARRHALSVITGAEVAEVMGNLRITLRENKIPEPQIHEIMSAMMRRSKQDVRQR